jgi:hypothetical protein
MEKVFVECIPDEALVKYFGISVSKIEHKSGKAKVCNLLRKRKGNYALVDQDPGSALHPYYSQLILLEEQHGLKIYTDKALNNKIIEICPRFEEWFVQTAFEAGINPLDYGLSDKAFVLHRNIHLRLKSFISFLTTLEKTKSKRFQYLKSHLTQ